MRIIKIIVFFSFSIFIIKAHGQDSTQIKKISPAVYFDYAKGVVGLLSKEEFKMEGGIELLFWDKWQSVFEMGTGTLQPKSAIENGNYHVKGNYYRIGIGFLPKIEKSSRMGVGLRYAKANFQDKASYLLYSHSQLQSDVSIILERKNLTAHWLEAIFYTDKRLNRWLDIGFIFRFRVMLHADTTEDFIKILKIPGYGNATDKSIPALNLFLKISLFD